MNFDDEKKSETDSGGGLEFSSIQNVARDGDDLRPYTWLLFLLED
jgi:hypothetical protein